MNPTKRKLIINLAILHTLKSCDGYLMPRDTLAQQTGYEVKPTMLLSEFDACLSGLEQLQFVTAARDELSGESKWKLTDLGKAKLNTPADY